MRNFEQTAETMPLNAQRCPKNRISTHKKTTVDNGCRQSEREPMLPLTFGPGSQHSLG